MSEITGKKTYTLAEAAGLSGASVEELLQAVKDGLLVARFAPETGLPLIDAPELTYFMRKTRRKPATGPGLRRRVFVLDDDTQFSETLRLELGLDRRLEARAATWSNDGMRLLDAFGPNLCLVRFRPMDATVEQIAKRLNKPAFRARCVVAAYTTGALAPDRMDEVGAFLSLLGLQTILSGTAGTKAIIVRCCELLGLESRTQVRRPQKGAGEEPD
jgi:hypothetical protein